MRVRVMVTSALVSLTLTGAVCAATAHPMFHPRWQVLPAGGVGTDGAYTILWSQSTGVSGTLVNELTGQSTLVVLPATCEGPDGGAASIGDTWLVAACHGYSVALYALATGQWRTLATPAACHHHVRTGPTCEPAAVGTDWIKYDESSVRLGDRWLFQNVVTGAVRTDPTNAHTLPDLDSPRLAEHVCPPLRVPSARSGAALALDGRFGVLTTSRGLFLEHCATHMRQLLTDAAPWATAAPGEIMWISRPTGPLHGIFLPSRRAFTVTHPPGADAADMAISARHIYLIGQTRRGTPRLWAAPLSALRGS